MTVMDEPEPRHYTGYLIRRAQQAHGSAWSREVSVEVSSVHYGVLAVLARRPGASQRELGDELDLDRSTVAIVAGRLEERGLIERTRSGGDRRRNALRLTARGAAELVSLRPRVEQVEHVLTDGLAPAEREELRRLLRIVLANAGSARVEQAS
jgi:DNA-binding MarR family transcriptional regulator